MRSIANHFSAHYLFKLIRYFTTTIHDLYVVYKLRTQNAANFCPAQRYVRKRTKATCKNFFLHTLSFSYLKYFRGGGGYGGSKGPK